MSLQQSLMGTDDATWKQFIDPDPVRWIETHFYIPETRAPLVLADYQRACIREALRQEDEQFIYSTILWSDIKKSAKSTIAAAVALWRAWQVDWGQVFIIANDLKQADSRVGLYVRRAIELHPEMRTLVKIHNYKITLPNRTTIESIPIDPTGEAGSNADMVVFSELWGAHQDAQQRMWAEMTLSPLKFGRSFRWVETYAGYRDTSVLLWSLYEQGVQQGERLDLELEMYRNGSARMFSVWNTVPRLGWQSAEYYAQEAAALTSLPGEFDRLHRNVWSAGGVDKFLPDMSWWDDCKGDVSLDRRIPVIVALDGAKNDDHCAMVAVSKHPTRPDVVVVRYARVWLPVGLKHDLDAIEQEVRDFCKAWRVLKVVYDPYQLHQMMTRLQNEKVVTTEEFDQTAERLVADKQLLDLIMEQRLMHDGNEVLKEHLDHAYRKLTDDRKLRIVKGPKGRKIDAAVALSMAAARCLNAENVSPLLGILAAGSAKGWQPT